MCVCIHNTKNQYRYIHIKSSKDKNNKYTNTYKNIIYKSISIIGCGQFFWKKNILYANYDKPLHIQNEQKDAQQELNQDEKEAHMREYIACELMKKKALSIRKINFQQYSITEIGANIPSPNKQVQCILCDIPANALLLRDKNEIAIAVCQNHVKNQILLNDTLAHELIHLYDYARAHVDTNDPEQLACTEIRASALSGECSRIRERNRGVITALNSGNKFRECIRRKVKLSLAMHENLRSKEDAIIDRVFERCLNDRSPFYTYQID